MINELIRSRELSQSYTSDWFQMRLRDLERSGEFLIAETINFLWENVRYLVGSPPTIIIECSENGFNPIFVKELALESVSNSSDSTSMIVTQLFNYIRFQVVPNSCEEGKIDIFINYR